MGLPDGRTQLQQWFKWLREEKRKDEARSRVKELRKQVTRAISGAKGGAGVLHRMTKPTAWRGGLQVMEHLEEDAKPMRKCGEKRQEWAKQ